LAADAQVAQEQSKLAAAKSGLAQAQAGLAQARGVEQMAQTAPQQIVNAEAQVKTAQAGVAQAQAALEVARQQLAYTKIVAPVSGRITRKSVQLGQVVDVGRNLLAIVPPDVWVTANFKETQLTRMHVGQAVRLRVDMYPGQTFQGRIESFQSGTGARFSLLPPENATGNYVKVVQRVPVKIVFDDEPGAKQLLAPGMSVVPRVKVGGDEGVPAPVARLGVR
jgi:membrane fusion protein (multidrug efflux system)